MSLPDLFSGNSPFLVSFKSSLQPFLRMERKTEEFLTITQETWLLLKNITQLLKEDNQ